MRNIYFLCICLLVLTCKEGHESNTISTESNTEHTLKYAKGFSIQKTSSITTIAINNPWPKSDKIFRFALIDKDEADAITINKDDYDGIIQTPINSLIVTSTTHIPSLELLNIENHLTGFPGTDYISSARTRQRIENGAIRELGTNEGINTEVLLELQPDLVVGFSVNGGNKSFETIKKSGIPVIFNGDWVEKTPLAKAEWIKFFGVLFNKEKESDSIFNSIETDYLEAKKIASQVQSKPTVMSGAMHKDIWYLPYGSSPEAQFLKDANVNYLWSDTVGNGSMALSFETVYDRAKGADIWISPSYYKSLNDLVSANDHYSRFEAFKNKRIYSFSTTVGKTGGVLYYEQGISRPDLVLKDIIKVCHPGLLKGYNPQFFKPLQ